MTAPTARLSYAELTPRERIANLVDGTSFREILTPFERVSSPYLAAQGIVPQRDDGVVVGRARVDGRDLAVAAIDGRFLGGSVGEIGGAKIASMLELAVDGALLLLDTGGIRLQEANLGLLAVAELCDAIVALRTRAPVIAVIAGRVGCYGGMSISASLCTYVIMSEAARFGLNGPEVVEQEAGVQELDSRDRPTIWRETGGIRRVAQGYADELTEDDVVAVRQAIVRGLHVRGSRTQKVGRDVPPSPAQRKPHASTRGFAWALLALEDGRRVEGYPASVCVVDGTIAAQRYRAIAVVPDPHNRFVRARAGEVGLDEALAIADAVRTARPDDAILAIVDLPGQAFGRREEAAGLHLALAMAVDAYITERRLGRQIFSLLVGKAISGGFLAHGMQAGWIGALDDAGIEIHVMSAASVARVTRARPEEVARVATIFPATARDVRAFAGFGAIDALFDVRDPLEPTIAELCAVRVAIARAHGARLGLRAPLERLKTSAATAKRGVALDVRRRIAAGW